jgi:hypothetical protein
VLTAGVGNVIPLTQGEPHRHAAVIRARRLTFADDNGLVPASAKLKPKEK